MNLQVLHKPFFHRALSLGLSAFLLFLTACQQPNEVGLGLISDGDIRLIYVDTLTLRTSTVLLDSINTSNPNLLLSGAYTDPEFGRIRATSYISYIGATVTAAQILPTEAILDSLAIDFSFAYFYGDSSQTQRLEAHVLNQPLAISKEYYNFSSVPFAAQALGSTTITPSTLTRTVGNVRGSNVRIRIDSPDLLARLGNISRGVNPIPKADIDNILPGIALVSEDNSQAVLGFDVAGSGITIFYHLPSDTLGQTAREFIAISAYGLASFNQIQSNRAGTPLASLSSQTPLPNTAYIQNGLGIATKIEIPYLNALKEGNSRLAINRAELIIFPEPNNSVFAPNSTLGLYFLTPEHRPVRTRLFRERAFQEEGRDLNSNTFPLRLSLSSNSRTYRALISSTLQRMQQNENISFLIGSSFYFVSEDDADNPISNANVNRMKLSITPNSTRRMRLELYYTLVK
ncbi:DUF4270 family protein [Eisenibacter elegans]|uniref:DUF4270 family protein n=1 Tax=Eisenibacter elegans TaxID=997 RepID=UPI00047D3BDF|nr:DUF4270 family protein [Eisenibacter elegans]